MQFFDFGTIFFLIAAVVIFIQLRSVLGRRTGNERQPFDPYTANRTKDDQAAEAKNDNVVTLPTRNGDAPVANRYAAIDKIAPEGDALNKGLRAVKDADGSFEPQRFLDGARSAYEMIITAFAKGERAMLKSLLSPEVYEGFLSAIVEREKLGEKVESTFVGINSINFINAGMKGSEAQLTLKIVSELISATRDASGAVIDGSPDAVVEITDVWTFARNTRSKDPNWKLVATEDES